jgi:hypothetical protein
VGSADGERRGHPEVEDDDDAGDQGEGEDERLEDRHHGTECTGSRNILARRVLACYKLVCGGCRPEDFGLGFGFASALRSVQHNSATHSRRKEGGRVTACGVFLLSLGSYASCSRSSERPRRLSRCPTPLGHRLLETPLLESNKHEFEAEGGRERPTARGDRLGNHRDGFDAVT